MKSLPTGKMRELLASEYVSGTINVGGRGAELVIHGQPRTGVVNASGFEVEACELWRSPRCHEQYIRVHILTLRTTLNMTRQSFNKLGTCLKATDSLSLKYSLDRCRGLGLLFWQ